MINGHHSLPEPFAERNSDSLLCALLWVCARHGVILSEAAFCSGLPKTRAFNVSVAIEALARQGFKGGVTKRAPQDISSLLLPAILVTAAGQAVVLLGCETDHHGSLRLKVANPENGFAVTRVDPEALRQTCSGYVLLVSKLPAEDTRAGAASQPGSAHWLWHTLWTIVVTT